LTLCPGDQQYSSGLTSSNFNITYCLDRFFLRFASHGNFNFIFGPATKKKSIAQAPQILYVRKNKFTDMQSPKDTFNDAGVLT